MGVFKKRNFLKSVEVGDWIALFALVVSIYSIWSGIQDSKYTRDFNQQQLDLAKDHDKRMVKPILFFYTEFSQNKNVGIYIKNKGVGPATIINSILKYDNKVFNDYDTLVKFMGDHNLDFSKYYEYTYPVNITLLPNEEVGLIYSSKDSLLPGQVSNAQTFLNNIQYTITYTSIYNDTSVVTYPNQ